MYIHIHIVVYVDRAARCISFPLIVNKKHNLRYYDRLSDISVVVFGFDVNIHFSLTVIDAKQ